MQRMKLHRVAAFLCWTMGAFPAGAVVAHPNVVHSRRRHRLRCIVSLRADDVDAEARLGAIEAAGFVVPLSRRKHWRC